MGLCRLMVGLCGLYLCLSVNPLYADEVWMKNGDHFTGTVVNLKEDVLVFETSYAGELSIQWEAIHRLNTDAPVKVVLSDDTTAHGKLRAGEGGRLILDAEKTDGPLKFHISHVQAINPPPLEPSVKLKVRLNAGLDIKKGNTDTKAYFLDGKFIARTEKNRYTIGGELNLEKEKDTKTTDNALFYMNYDHFFAEKWFLYAYTNFEKDDFKDLNWRTTLGTGVGYQIFEREELNLSLKAGPTYVNEDYDVADDSDYASGSWSVDYDQYFFEKFVQAFHFHEGIVSLEDSEDMIVRARTGLRFPMKYGFNTTLQYNWDWDNSPAPGKDKVDERYLITLGYTWGE